MNALTLTHFDTRHGASIAAAGRRRTVAYFVAVAATFTSIVVSTIAAVYRGGTIFEKAAWVLAGAVLLLGAHLLPAMSKPLGRFAKGASLFFWVFCLAATAYGHATFFLLAQDHAGQLRASTIKDPAGARSTQAQGRDPTKIASDKALVQRELAWIDSLHCRESCDRLRYRRVVASARLVALDVELAQSERGQRLADALAAEQAEISANRTAAAADPVTIRIASLVGADVGAINLCLAVALGLIVEGIGSLSWTIALADPDLGQPVQNDVGVAMRPQAVSEEPINSLEGKRYGTSNASRDGVTQPATLSVHAPVSNDRVTPVAVTQARWSNEASNDIVRQAPSLPAGDDRDATAALQTEDVTADLTRLHAGIELGEVRATVASIRKYFRCSQKRAMLINREYARLKAS
ncbi:hypothetical protein [Burkholderia sp. Ac-20353]|uniref:hypothetical protein n=1 Tax=Burkholderia sp. Ac-20353 TaxID=2703894 RepID=UPI00197C0925|nr:hypothetical protein [Burkholderia sp. Ac-20353]MBN3785718.1 hypothetical protein [Burkholderia sp. Ac-20353]